MTFVDWVAAIFCAATVTWFAYILYVAKQLTKAYECRTCHGHGYLYVADLRPIQCPDCKGARHFPGMSR